MWHGALAIECRANDVGSHYILSKINDYAIEKAVLAERIFLSRFDEGEQALIGGYAYVRDGYIHLHGMVIHSNGQQMVEHQAVGTEPEKVARDVAQVLIDQGALEIIEAGKQESQSS